MWKSLETLLWLKGHLIELELKTVKNPEKLLVSANLFSDGFVSTNNGKLREITISSTNKSSNNVEPLSYDFLLHRLMIMTFLIKNGGFPS